MFLKTSAILFVTALIVLATAGSRTYAADPFRGSGFVLGESDLALVKTAAGKLYMTDDVEVGAVEEWANPETGSHGTVKLTRKHEYKGLPCRELQHEIELKGTNSPYRFALDRCKTDEGEWKILAR